MTVLVKVQDSTGNKIGSFHAEDGKSLAELCAMHEIEILQVLFYRFSAECICVR
jgi:hypothetical protein